MKMFAVIYVFQSKVSWRKGWEGPQISQWQPGNVFDCPDNLHLVFETMNIASSLLCSEAAMHLLVSLHFNFCFWHQFYFDDCLSNLQKEGRKIDRLATCHVLVIENNRFYIDNPLSLYM